MVCAWVCWFVAGILLLVHAAELQLELGQRLAAAALQLGDEPAHNDALIAYGMVNW
jgi:hypothetical protein